MPCTRLSISSVTFEPFCTRPIAKTLSNPSHLYLESTAAPCAPASTCGGPRGHRGPCAPPCASRHRLLRQSSSEDPECDPSGTCSQLEGCPRCSNDNALSTYAAIDHSLLRSVRSTRGKRHLHLGVVTVTTWGKGGGGIFWDCFPQFLLGVAWLADRSPASTVAASYASQSARLS